jgi:hypothetical protein
MGMEDAEKEIEDLKKALWYIEDYRVKIPQLLLSHFKSRARIQQIVIEVTGHALMRLPTAVTRIMWQQPSGICSALVLSDRARFGSVNDGKRIYALLQSLSRHASSTSSISYSTRK